MELNYETIALRIRTIRKNRSITQEELAEKTGLTVMHISNLENNRSKMSLDSLSAIAHALDISTDQLLYGRDTHPANGRYSEMCDYLIDCSDKEMVILIENMKALKKIMRDHQD